MALTTENVAEVSSSTAGGAPGAGDDIRNLTDTARFFGITPPTLREWIVRGAPVLEGGSNGVPYRFSLRDVGAWRQGELDQAEAERQARQASDQQLALEIFGEDFLSPGDAAAGGGVLSAKQIREHADAQKALVAVELARGRLVRADEMAAALTAAMRIFADRVRALPDELARRHGLGADQVAALADDLDEALNDLADQVVEHTGGGA